MGRNIDSEEETKAVTLEAAKDHKKDRKSKKSKNVNIVLNSENGAEADGHDEVSKKKKNKKRKKERNGVENEGVDGDDETRSVDVSEKRKKEEMNGVKNGEEMLNCENVSNEKEVNGVVVSGKGSGDLKYAALKTFAEARLPVNVIECCKGFSKPSPIQAHSWPFLLDGRDLIGIAATGSGKTIAFGVPALMHVLKKKGKESLKKEIPRCLVLSPTRELAQQISDVLCDAGKTCGVKTVCVYGGTSKGPQISALKSGVSIVIGTPGRLKDLIEMGICNLKDISFVFARWLCSVQHGLILFTS